MSRVHTSLLHEAHSLFCLFCFVCDDIISGDRGSYWRPREVSLEVRSFVGVRTIIGFRIEPANFEILIFEVFMISRII